MKEIAAVIKEIESGRWDPSLVDLYGTAEGQRERYIALAKHFETIYQEKTAAFFSAPGRTEIGGNHTDHNHGRVLAAGIDLDTLAAAAPVEDPYISIRSEGYPEMKIDLSRLDPVPEERETAPAVVRGVVRGFVDRGYRVDGFKAVMTSRVLRGSGLSSSASFEVLLGTILSGLYNGGAVDLTEIAQTAQFAENVFYGKPCGLMDQMACAHAGLVAIDFADPERPRLERLQIRFDSLGYQLMVVNTRGDHADLSGHYADIPREMKAAAAVLGRQVLRDVTLEELHRRAGEVRKAAGDRAFLRAYHFIQENRRVEEQLAALEHDDFSRFLDLVNRSGRSSFQYLQNVFVAETPQTQEMAVGLAAAEALLEGRGAVRVHGGGFAGTILALVPMDASSRFEAGMNSLFGEGAVQPLIIRNRPAGPVGEAI